MISTEVRLPPNAWLEKIKKLVERTCRDSKLDLKMKCPLVEYPDSVHCHYKNGKQVGTLEITLWKKEKRLWFSVQERRNGP